MLSKNQMVAVRKAVESMYVGVCDVVEYNAVKRENGSVGFSEVVVIEKLPCRVSFGSKKRSFDSSKPTVETVTATKLGQQIKLFVSPEVDIKAGSKIITTQNGLVTVYKNTGQPIMHGSHQEISVSLFEGWT